MIHNVNRQCMLTFSDLGFTEVNAFQFAGTAAQEREDGLIRKGILRTGHWPVTPTDKGKLKKALSIVKEGSSDYEKGIISLADIQANFGKRGELVQVPLAQADQSDHTNKTINNTGFVRSVWLEDRPEWGVGHAELMAAIEFTKKDVEKEVKAGTFADVSSGVPWIESDDGKWKPALDHVCITNKPFIKGQTPFLFADDDNVEVAVATLEPPAPPDPDAPGPVDMGFFFRSRMKEINDALERMNLHGYEVEDASPSHALIKHEVAGKTWLVPYSYMEGEVLLPSTGKWVVKEQSVDDAPLDDKPNESEAKTPDATDQEPAPVATPQMSALEEAQKARELQLSQSTNTNTGGTAMPNTKLLSLLEGVKLSEEQRAALEAADEQAQNDRRAARESQANTRIEELRSAGITTPGALKLYRSVFLSDDGGPAAILFSDDGKSKKEVKAIEILDLFIAAAKGADGQVQFSDQAIDTGTHEKPPLDSGKENKPLDERVKETRSFLNV